MHSLKKILVLCTVWAALLPCASRAATLTWTSTTSNDWNVAGNWSPAQVPGAADSVVISSTLPPSNPALAGNKPFFGINTGAAVTIASLDASASGNFTNFLAQGPETLQITGNITGPGPGFSLNFLLPVLASGTATWSGDMQFQGTLNLQTSQISITGNTSSVVINPGNTITFGIQSSTTYGQFLGGGSNIAPNIGQSGGGTAFVNIVSLGYAGNLGDVFQFAPSGVSVFQYAQLNFSQLPTLSSGLTWDTSNFTDGKLTVIAVPEPAVLGMLVAAGLTMLLIRRRSRLSPVRISAFVALLFSMSARAQLGPVNIQIVNDTGLPDSNFYVRAIGKTATNASPTPMTPAGFYTAIGETNAAAATALPLNGLPVGTNFTSTVTGATNLPAYQTEWYNVDSGQIYFQYITNAAQAFVYTNAVQPSTLPDGQSLYRFDFAEATVLTNANGQNNAMDVTYVEKFGFPMKIEWFRGNTLINAAYCHANTTTIAKAFEALGLSPAVFGVSTNASPTSLTNWNSSDNITNFARIITPYKLSASAFTFPYPSVSRYMNTLASSATTYGLNSSGIYNGEYFVGYDVTFTTNSPASNDPDNPPGWLVTMTYNSNSIPSYYIPPNVLNGSSATRYTNTLTYIIPFASGSYTFDSSPGIPPAMKRDGVPLNTNTALPVELWMAGDVNTGLNLGFYGGLSSVGTNNLNWFLIGAPLNPPAPFGAARATNTAGNDGFYNLYMSLLYQYTDFYGYTYGERYTPAVLFTPVPGDTVRFTILPDQRLESPTVSISGVTTDSVTLNWQAFTNASGFNIQTVEPLNVPLITNIPANATNYTITNLASGTPYVFEVHATNTATNGNPISSAARPLTAVTAGALPMTPVNGTTALIQIPIDNGIDTFQRLSSVTINGTNYPLYSDHIHFYATNGTPIQVLANTGTNSYTLAAYDTNNALVYYNWFNFELGQSTINTSNYAISNAEAYGLAGRFPIPVLAGTNATNPAYSIANFPVGSISNPAAQIPLTMFVGGQFQNQGAVGDVVAGGNNNYAQWINQYYNASTWPKDQPQQDPDGDQADNLVEYSRGTDPMVFNSAPGVSLTNSGTTLNYAFNWTTNAGDLMWQVSWSRDMTNWNYAGITNTLNTATNSSYQMNLGTNTKVFFNTDIIIP